MSDIFDDSEFKNDGSDRKKDAPKPGQASPPETGGGLMDSVRSAFGSTPSSLPWTKGSPPPTDQSSSLSGERPGRATQAPTDGQAQESDTGEKDSTSKKSGSSKKQGSSRSARDAVGGGRSKEDRQRESAGKAGAAVAKGLDPSGSSSELGENIGKNIADIKNAKSSSERSAAKDQLAENALRAAGSAYTGGQSEKVVKSMEKNAAGRAGLKAARVTVKVVRRVATAAVAVQVIALLLIPVLLVVAVVAVVSGSSGFAGNVDYALTSQHPLAIRDEYLTAYKNAAAEHDIPWTILAGIGQVATQHGRTAPSDLSDYGGVVDRSPNRGPLNGSYTRGSRSANKFSPPAGSSVVVIGDSIVAGIEPGLRDSLSTYDLSFVAESGARVDRLQSTLTAAFSQGSPVVVIQAGVNDVYQSVPESRYRNEIASILDAGSGSQCVIWVNLQSRYGGKYVQMGPAAQRFNAVLAEEVSKRQWASVADFATASSMAGLQADDGLHLNSAGNNTWVDVVTRQLYSCGSGTSPAQGPPAPGTAAAGTSAAGIAASGTSPTLTDPSYGSFVCQDGICGPNPRIGAADTEPLGPFLLDPEFVKNSGKGRSPDDIDDALDMLAGEIARLKESALSGPSAEFFSGWSEDPAAAAQLWSYVLAQAPVVLPATAFSSSSCATGPTAGAQGAGFSWPVAEGVSLREFGSELDGAQIAGIELASSTSNALSAGAGAVADVGTDELGSYVVVAHGGGFSTKYSRLTGTSLTVGEKLQTASVVGTFVSSFFFQTMVDGSPRNPRSYLDASVPVPIESGAVDPQAGSSTTTDPQAGVPIDPCTGLKSTVSFTPVSSTASGTSVPTELVIPVAGVPASRLVDSWGNPRSGGRQHQGIDIVVAIGVPVIATTGGVVQDDFDNGMPCPTDGKPPKSVVVVDDLGNHYYYAHLDTISVAAGQRVVPGQLVGTVGQTGNACVSVPHLHFSINEGRENVVNPYPLLSKARSLSISDFSTSLGSSFDALSSLSSINGSGDLAVAYASFFGGLVANDPNAGVLPTVLGTQVSFGSNGAGDKLAGENPEAAAAIRLYFPPEQWDNAIRLANCESGLNPNSVSKPNSNGTRDWGLFQFNDGGTLQGMLSRLGEDPTDLSRALDPNFAARAAYTKWDLTVADVVKDGVVVEQRGGYGAWTCAHMPTETYKNLLGLVGTSPRESSGEVSFDYQYHVPGPGDTSNSFTTTSGSAGKF